ncbi:hypothetical protein EJ07DRAFT_154347 [Lizonia empirigonia]|nr:hypothetical protein EJ07DRAFT_154347 [Lizonia empirigonia]
MAATGLPRIRQGIWYDAECKLCGGPVECRNVHSYRAIRALLGEESLEDTVPVLEDPNARRIIIGSFRASCIRSIGSLPGVYLTHLRCIRILRKAANCNKQEISILKLISILSPMCSVDKTRFQPLSDLDEIFLTRIFSPQSLNSRHPQLQIPRLCPTLQDLLYNLPPELLSQILSNCQPDHALMISVGLKDSFWKQAVKEDLARQYLIVGIQAAQLLQNQPHSESYTEKVIKLSGKMVARFVPLGSEVYLQDILKRCEYRNLSEWDIEFCVDTPSRLLAIQASHLGVCNVAFRYGTDGTPEFLRNARLLPNMFVDRVDDDSFILLRLVSDSIKVRMMDIARPDCNSPHPQPLVPFSPHLRPLLPYRLGRWAPYSVTTIREPSLPIEGYFIPSLCGIFDEKGEDREEVSLGAKLEPRTVRLYGIQRRSCPLGNMPFLQKARYEWKMATSYLRCLT